MKNSSLFIIILLCLSSCIEKPVNNSNAKTSQNNGETILSEVKVKSDEDWINEGYELKTIKVEDNRCACRKGIQYDTGERCRIHEYDGGECGSLTPYPKGDSRGIGSEFCKKPRAIKGVSTHGHHTWFVAVTYKEVNKWVKTQ